MIVKVYTGNDVYGCKTIHSMAVYMLWFNFIPGLIFIFFCFKLIIIYYHTQKQKKIKIKPRIKLNHNIYTLLQNGQFYYSFVFVIIGPECSDHFK